MEAEFDAKAFLERMSTGAFNGRLHEELHKLSDDQLEEIGDLMRARLEQHETA